MLRTLILAGAACACSCLAQAPALTAAPSPSLKPGKVYELRIYHAAPGKLEALHDRFRKHTNALFRKHGIEIVGFWGPLDKEKGSENQLIYVLAYPSREAREAAWKAFGADADWQAARKASEVGGRLAEKVDAVLMGEVDYFSPGRK